MDRFERKLERFERRKNRCSARDRGGNIATGVLLLAIGAVGLMKAFMLPIPDWVFTWQMLLIGIGLYIGVRHQFRGGTWFVIILIGGIFLLNDIYPELAFRKYSWSLVLIVIGGWLILRPHHRPKEWKEVTDTATGTAIPGNENFSSEDFIDNTTIFGGIKKTILSKNFKGGDIVNIMGGSEINLGQADIQGVVEIEITQVFGGTKLIVPAHWEVKQEVVAIFGGVEDKRSMQQVSSNPDKVLVLRGTTLFGGIEIKSF